MSESCPYCRVPIAESEGVQCPACRTPHHLDCWRENGGCTVFGCQHAPAEEPKIQLAPGDVSGHGLVHAAPQDASYLVHRHGQQYGPYPQHDLLRYVSEGRIAATDVAWRAGMPNWVPVAQLLLAAYPLSYGYPPGPQQSGDVLAGRLEFGRAAYFASLLGVAFISGFLLVSHESAGVGRVLLYGGCAACMVFRLRDVGHSGWMALLGFVPFANFYVAYLALCAPRGYAFSKKADTTMVALSWTYGALIVLALAILFVKHSY